MNAVRVVDVRPSQAYAAGHVPGAVHLDPEQELSAAIVDAAHGGRHPLPSVDELEETFANAGIDGETFVLAYDSGTGWAARCWWLLRHVGHDHAGTLPFDAYIGPLSTDTATPRPAQFEARARSGDTVEAEEILARLEDPALVLLDARSPERWRGDIEPLDPVAGRIPGALNAPFTEALPDDVAESPEPVAYCGSGVTACVVAQQLVLAGRDDVRLYPGSFGEWCRREGYPIERGEP